jgi:Zn-dependent protease with chaperone function
MTTLPYLLHGATLALAWLLLFNVVSTASVAIVSALLTKRSRTESPGFWLALRLSPAALSIAFVAVVFLPSYWRYEPRELVEGFDVSLTTLAVLAVAVLGAAVARGVTAWSRAQRRARDWLRVSRPLALTDIGMPAYAIDTDAPVMALVGVLRPRLLITRPVLEALTDEELRASVAHELGHQRAWDNLKRLAMRAAPDLLFATGAAHLLERRWAAAAERVADRRAGDSGRERCALASALVKVARLTPPVNPVADPISALVDGGDITARVESLLDDAPCAATRRPGRWLALAIPAAGFALGYTPLLRVVHGVTEILVNGLP